MVLKNVGPLINGLLLSILLDLLLKVLVGLDDIDQLLRQIVLGSLIVVLENRGADLRRRDRKNGTHHPVRPAPETAKPHEVYILVADAAEKAIDILWLQKAAEITGSYCCITYSHR
jgi:hypothetical protein